MALLTKTSLSSMVSKQMCFEQPFELSETVTFLPVLLRCETYRLWFHQSTHLSSSLSHVFSALFAPHAAGALPFPLIPSLPVFCSVLLVPFLGGFNYFLLLSISFLSTRIVPLRFQAGGCRKRPNLGLVCCVYFVLSVFLS